MDDGSDDGSEKICDKYALKDDRIHVIHQKNKGLVEARKRGVFSKGAKNSRYITFVDSDDSLPRDALEKMLEIAKQYNADLVCGKTIRKWKNIAIPQKSNRPCFEKNTVKEYVKQDIIDQLYIGCFGINDFPVNLWGKLYKTACIQNVIDVTSGVIFYGEDLSVTLNVLPQCKKVVTFPETVYYYRVGGATSKYNPYMLQDFLTLYQYKQKKAAEKINNVELAKHIRTGNYQLISERIWQTVRRNRFKDGMKKILLSI
mgnify:CR=1 FL=1